MERAYPALLTLLYIIFSTKLIDWPISAERKKYQFLIFAL